MKSPFPISGVLILICICLFEHNVNAQVISYKRNTLEVKVGIGGSLFFGDLGGSKGKRKDTFLDFDPASMRGNSSMGLKFNLSNRLALRTDYSIAQVYGDDAFSEDQSRYERNLSFRSTIHEMSVTGEVVLINLSSFGKNRRATSEIYTFVGGGVIRFNPQAELNGVWYDLQPLGTEGQGLTSGNDFYALQTFVIPYGFGYRKSIGKDCYLGVELSMRKTFTDYLDDVSGNYPDFDELREARGEVAVQLSNRRLDGAQPSNGQRGNPNNNDNYSFMQLTFSKGIGRGDTRTSGLIRRFARNRDRCPQVH